MQVSLITTVRDERSSVAALIEAIGRQSRPPDEWIVVDGGSTDGTDEILSASSACSALRIPGGISHGRNAAVEAASHPVIAVTDAGCRPEPRWLERLVGPFEDPRADVDVVVGATVPEIRRPFDAAQWIVLDQFVRPDGRLRPPAASSRSLAFRREVWRSQPYPEWLEAGEDTWVIDSWRRAGRRIVRADDAVVAWQLRETLPAVRRQHVRYMRGDGRALMHPVRHALRFGLYALLAAGIGLGAAGAAAAAVVWMGYLAATALARGPATLAGRGFAFSARTLLWLPALLATVDTAKMEGFVRGVGIRFGAGRGGRS